MVSSCVEQRALPAWFQNMIGLQQTSTYIEVEIKPNRPFGEDSTSSPICFRCFAQVCSCFGWRRVHLQFAVASEEYRLKIDGKYPPTSLIYNTINSGYCYDKMIRFGVGALRLDNSI